MELDAITPQLVERTLRHLQEAKQIPSDWQRAHFLEEDGALSPVELRYRLCDHLSEVGQEALTSHRRDGGIADLPILSSSQADLETALAADFRVGRASLEAWSALYYRYLALPGSELSRDELAEASNVDAHQFRRRVKTGLNYLTDVLRRSEREAHQRLKRLHLRRHLPPPEYRQLFGISEPLEQAMALIEAEDGPSFVSIEGMGGMGKTALAREVGYRLAEREDLAGLAWISARQEWLTPQGELQSLDDPARSLEDVVARLVEQLNQRHLAGLAVSDKIEGLRTLLASSRHLIIIDNLETLNDSQALLPALQPLAGVTRFLLTSRYTLEDFAGVQVIPLPELSASASQRLLESEIRRRGQQRHLSERAMQAIYETIGGLPLALKLVASQVGTLPLNHILDSLRQAREDKPEAMYRYIYRRSWQLLDDHARQLLCSMLLISSEGEDVTWLRLMSTLPDRDFASALEQLRYYSLVETTGSLEAPIYRLHRLTVTFLQNDILYGPEWS